MLRKILFIGFILSISACTHLSGDSVPLMNGYRFSLGQASPKARIFLVAGTEWSVSHAKELVQQKKLWLERGYSKEEIACYYFPPSNEDMAKFEPYFHDLIDCYLADPNLLLSHIRGVARSNPESVYIYISSTGRKPMVNSRFTYKTANDKIEMDKILALRNWSEPYSVEMIGMHKGRKYYSYDSFYKAKLFGATYPNGADNFMITPRGLRAALESLPEKTKKMVVLQACYTEGFVLPEKKVGAPNTLAGLKNISVIAASPADVVSRKCEDGYPSENFGEAYNYAVKKYFEILPKNSGDLISQSDWKKVFSYAEEFARERDVFVNEKSPLRPKFYSN